MPTLNRHSPRRSKKSGQATGPLFHPSEESTLGAALGGMEGFEKAKK
jgi:hypothetical protein